MENKPFDRNTFVPFAGWGKKTRCHPLSSSKPNILVETMPDLRGILFSICTVRAGPEIRRDCNRNIVTAPSYIRLRKKLEGDLNRLNCSSNFIRPTVWSWSESHNRRLNKTYFAWEIDSIYCLSPFWMVLNGVVSLFL